MPAIDFRGSAKPAGSRITLKWVLAILASVTLVFFGTTFASNLNLNSGNNIEFGQGIAATVACQVDPLIITPSQEFNNTDQTFILSAIAFDNISPACFGTYFKISVWPNSGNAPLIDFAVSGVDGIHVDAAGDVVSGATSLNLDGTGKVTLSTIYNSNFDGSNSNNIPAATIGKITAESSPSLPALGGELASLCELARTCALGDVGPGGGVIFYASVSPFTAEYSRCKNNCFYLESAPANWISPATPTWSANTSDSVAGLSDQPGVNDQMGAGSRNTYLMSQQSGAGDSSTNAGLLALSFDANDHSAGQWYLPSHSELNTLLDYSSSNQGRLGLSMAAAFWSSNEVSDLPTQSYVASYGYPQFGLPKNWPAIVVAPIRAF